LRILLGESADVVAIERHAEAWTEFWNDQNEADGCCAHASEIQHPISEHWAVFAKSLDEGSNVLDLACGTGAAARLLVVANPALRVTGIDFATVPASTHPRIELLPNVKMERLPFADRSFGAAISQFGFEYGAVELATAELSRVLRPGAPFSFLVHHADGRIARDSVSHRQALQEIRGRAMEAAFMSGDAAQLDRQLANLRRHCPHERIIDEAGDGLCRLIRQSLAHREEIWRAVRAAIEPELVMLADLGEAAVSREALSDWLGRFDRGLELRRIGELEMRGGNILCWTIEGVRKARMH
jgi:SAM-dependent methyltransferase